MAITRFQCARIAVNQTIAAFIDVDGECLHASRLVQPNVVRICPVRQTCHVIRAVTTGARVLLVEERKIGTRRRIGKTAARIGLHFPYFARPCRDIKCRCFAAGCGIRRAHRIIRICAIVVGGARIARNVAVPVRINVGDGNHVVFLARRGDRICPVLQYRKAFPHNVGHACRGIGRWLLALQIADAFVIQLADGVQPLIDAGAAEFVDVIDDAAVDCRIVAIGRIFRVVIKHAGCSIPFQRIVGGFAEAGRLNFFGADIFHRRSQHATIASGGIVQQIPHGGEPDFFGMPLHLAHRFVVAAILRA